MPQNNKPGRRLLRQLYGSWYRVRHNISIFVRWCLFAVIIGVVVGAVGAAFEHALEWATETRQEQSWTLYFLPLVGVFIAFWYSKMDMPLERGTNFILTSVRQDHPVRLRLAPSIFITSVLTHLCGGSAGREGAALQLGGAISGNIGHLMHLDDKDSRTITMCGMAACFSALFGTPLAASVFAMGYQRGRDVLRGAVSVHPCERDRASGSASLAAARPRLRSPVCREIQMCCSL
ncbi:MAG: chloride channel protein [Butyricicoccus sp.]